MRRGCQISSSAMQEKRDDGKKYTGKDGRPIGGGFRQRKQATLPSKKNRHRMTALFPGKIIISAKNGNSVLKEGPKEKSRADPKVWPDGRKKKRLTKKKKKKKKKTHKREKRNSTPGKTSSKKILIERMLTPMRKREAGHRL